MNYTKLSDKLSCQIKLGNLYEEIEDYDNAVIWYKIASESGDIESKYRLGRIYENLAIIDKAKYYFKLSTEDNHLESQIYLGKIYFDESDMLNAKAMFEIGANENNVYSQHMLGIINQQHLKEYDDAKYWYEKARSNKCIESIYNLGMMNIELNDYEQAQKYFEEGRNLGSNECKYMLAWLNYNKAKQMYKELSEINFSDSENVYENLLELRINKISILPTRFVLNENIEEEEEYAPEYILSTTEFESMKEGLLTNMLLFA